MTVAEKDVMLFHICEYLKKVGSEGEYGQAVASIESTFSSTASDVYKSAAFCPNIGLDAIFDAGKAALKLQGYTEAANKAESNPKFDAFLELVTSKGYFADVDVGSVGYLERYNKLLTKFQQKTSAPTKEELEAKAEELKLAGNAAINAKDYQTAIRLYTEALECSPDGSNSHFYYSNRAAAHCGMQHYQESVDDCTQAIVLNPDFARAYSRLGLSYFFLNQYQESVDAYERAVELEPGNKQSQDSLKSARNKLRKSRGAADAAAASSGGAAGDGGMMPDLAAMSSMMGGGAGGPDMSSLLANPKMKEAYEKAGGAAGISNMMKDPAMMSMAQQMMKNPAMMQQAMAMMGGGGAGAGSDTGMPDISALMGMMGGAPSSSSAGSSSSSSGAKKPFKGFEE